ncbi:MAG: 2-oxoglutarate dehydrogenase E1 component [Pseudomonadota bacterium]
MNDGPRQNTGTSGDRDNHDDLAGLTPSESARALSPANLAFIEQMYYQFVADPDSVDPSWRERFGRMGEPVPPPPESFPRSIFASASPPSRPVVANGNGAGAAAGGVTARDGGAISSGNGGAVAALVAAAAPLIRKTSSVSAERVQRLVEAYREMGHLSADLDPLGLVKRNAGASLDMREFGLSESDLGNVFSSENVAGPDRTTLGDLIALLRETYCRHIGVELAHLHDVELRSWLLHRMESTRNRINLNLSERRRLLAKAIDAEVFEQFLHTKFLGKKRFSLEGAESVIPLLDRLVERAGSQGVTEIVIGMAHRGRLNVLANVLEKPAAQIFAEFIDKETTLDGPSGGDVKYHLGHSVDRTFGANGSSYRVHVSLAFNPSHLEFVNTVVQGRVRAKQDRHGDVERVRCLPVVLHGDAAFAGQGVVAEGLNMSELAGYRVGGTVHVVINNQIGFTTTPSSEYSSTYATDVARMLQIPIFHVNGEDPEAIAQVVDLAVDFRQRFHRDVLIEVWCYRKWGHNEGDEPEFTQPVMYKAIKRKGSIRTPFLQALRDLPFSEGPLLTEADADEMAATKRHALEGELDVATHQGAPVKPSTFAGAWSRVRGGSDASVPEVPTSISKETLAGVGRALTTVPAGFAVHPKLTVLKDRAAMAAGERPCNWGMGEALAFGSLLAEGVRVRLSGQDSRRGTFSHRHSVLIDYETGAEYTPLSHVGDVLGTRQGLFEARDSPLSEAGVLGFDYGYSLDMPDGLTIWEAQFGDFVNSAQVIVDQFVVSSEAKWNRVSGLVMLLPHGMEGQGPEHSSARLERFLTMSVRDNIQVCNPTTPAQFFHVLRRQVLRLYRKPLIVMSPKSLLRHPAATSALAEFTAGEFQRIIPDQSQQDPGKVRRILLCTGKVYFDLVAAREERRADDVAIIRIEQLYPLRKNAVMDVLRRYRGGTPVIWVQEEPRNMGAWSYINRQLPGELLGLHPWACVTRERSASPAAGSEKRHKLEQAKLLDEAFAGDLSDTSGAFAKGTT